MTKEEQNSNSKEELYPTSNELPLKIGRYKRYNELLFDQAVSPCQLSMTIIRLVYYFPRFLLQHLRVVVVRRIGGHVSRFHLELERRLLLVSTYFFL